MQPKKIVIAVDGFSSCGKSTMARALANRIGYIYVDSGAMYRAITLYCIDNELIIGEQVDEPSLQQHIAQGRVVVRFELNTTTGRADTLLNGVNVEAKIRTLAVSNKVSIVSALSFVRKFMVEQQQQMGEEKGIVMDGRDIGTVVFPQAELKIFVTASSHTRAQRRVDELVAKGEQVSFDEVKQNIEQRDHVDQTRVDSPLVKANDALLLDNSTLTIEQQNHWIYTQYCNIVKCVVR